MIGLFGNTVGQADFWWQNLKGGLWEAGGGKSIPRTQDSRAGGDSGSEGAAETVAANIEMRLF